MTTTTLSVKGYRSETTRDVAMADMIDHADPAGHMWRLVDAARSLPEIDTGRRVDRLPAR